MLLIQLLLPKKKNGITKWKRKKKTSKPHFYCNMDGLNKQIKDNDSLRFSNFEDVYFERTEPIGSTKRVLHYELCTAHDLGGHKVWVREGKNHS